MDESKQSLTMKKLQHSDRSKFTIVMLKQRKKNLAFVLKCHEERT